LTKIKTQIILSNWIGIFNRNFLLEFSIEIFNWNFQLEFSVGILNWNFQLEFWIGILSWNFQLEFSIGISIRKKFLLQYLFFSIYYIFSVISFGHHVRRFFKSVLFGLLNFFVRFENYKKKVWIMSPKKSTEKSRKKIGTK